MGNRDESFSFSWEMQNVNFGDERLKKRFISVLERAGEHPSLPINGASHNWAETMGAYRLYANEEVRTEEILRAHREETMKRMSHYEWVVAPQDTTSLSFTSHLSIEEELGSIAIGAAAKSSKGLFVHTTEVLSPSGTPLGIAEQRIWSRALLSEEDELFYTEKVRWIESLETLGKMKKQNPHTEIICVSDRESDFTDYLVKAGREGIEIVVRVIEAIRSNDEGEKLVDCLREEKVQDRYYVKARVGKQRIGGKRSGNGRRYQARKTRKALVALRFGEVTLHKRFSEIAKTASKEELTFRAVFLEEINPPKGEEPVSWLLLTSLPVKSLTDARKVVHAYELRWEMENLHKILKSGCRVESSRLGGVEKLMRFVTTMSLVAWRLQVLTKLSREHPDAPCTCVLNEPEWQALYVKIKNTAELPNAPPSLREATHWIARLGGFLDRKHDKEPGPLTLWRGWQRLMDLADMYAILQGKERKCV